MSARAGSAGGNGDWRLLVTPPAAGAWNMAVDECLMESVRAGGAPTLRFYRWSPACLSFGRNQPARDVYSGLTDGGLSIDIVRRPTGGRAVLHDAELTYAVVVPARSLGGARAAYRRINQVLLDGLSRLGVRVGMVDQGKRRAPIPSTAPCFVEPLPGELLHEGRKVVGSAQVHREGVLLQHGSILIGRSRLAAAVEAATGVPIGAGAAYLDEAGASSIAPGELVRAIAEAWREQVGALATGPLTDDEVDRAAHLTRAYSDPAWTWRR